MQPITAIGTALLASSALFASGAAIGPAPHQDISVAASRAMIGEPVQFFTGNVRITPLFDANKEAPVAGAYVSFDAGARSAWHTHPYGQRLVITSGTARTQVWGGPVMELKAGDVLWCPPGVKHWHGAGPAQAMTHLALTNTVDGKNVDWMEKVTDEQYGKAPSPGKS